jgi:hypothetical protein
MVWSITGAESYVWDIGKSMKAAELPVFEDGCRRNISITLIEGF